MLRVFDHLNGIKTLQSPLLNDCGVKHAFSTRVGGVSPAPFVSLNLAAPHKDPLTDANTNITANFRVIREAMGLQRLIRIETRQVHGADVWHAPEKPLPLTQAPDYDGVVTGFAQHLLVCRTADCVPVLMASEDGRFVGCAHAGWRGLIAGVIPEAVARLSALAGVAPERVVAAIGPCIGLERFEVGEEVAQRFVAGVGDCVDATSWAKPHVDLQRCARKQLEAVGVQRIDGNDFCTHRDASLFFSYRRDGAQTGRMAALITPTTSPTA